MGPNNIQLYGMDLFIFFAGWKTSKISDVFSSPAEVSSLAMPWANLVLNQALMVMGGCHRLQCVPEKHFPTIVANKNILYSWGMGYHGYQHWYMMVQRLLSPVITFSDGNHSNVRFMDRNVSTWNSGVDGTHTRHMINMNHFAVPLVPFSAKWPVQRKCLDIFLSTLLQKFKTRLVWRFGEDEFRSENKGNGGIVC